MITQDIIATIKAALEHHAVPLGPSWATRSFESLGLGEPAYEDMADAIHEYFDVELAPEDLTPSMTADDLANHVNRLIPRAESSAPDE